MNVWLQIIIDAKVFPPALRLFIIEWKKLIAPPISLLRGQVQLVSRSSPPFHCPAS
jgi:hypothetical protein